jgi:hypothetical protein
VVARRARSKAPRFKRASENHFSRGRAGASIAAELLSGRGKMRRYRNRIFVCCLASLWLGASSHANESRTISKEDAKRALNFAMEAEMSGDFARREQLLEDAAKHRANSLAQAQQGLLRLGRSDWMTIEEAAAKIADSEKMQRYEKLRTGFQDTATGNWAMASQCMKFHLTEQAQAHLQRVIQIDPEHQAARAALGFRKVDGEWISPERMALEQELQKAQQAAVAKHGRTMLELAPKLQSPQEWERKRAEYRLSTLREPAMALAADQVLTPISDALALLVIEHIRTINDSQVTQTIARHAIGNSSQVVRDRAADALRGRDLHAYAPGLLSLLSMPIRVEVEAIVNERGEVRGYRQVFERVTMERSVVVGAETTRIGSPPTSSESGASTKDASAAQRARSDDQAQSIAKASLTPASMQLQRDAAALNVKLALRNEQVIDVLRRATGADLPDDPQAWWNWYENRIGIEVEGRDYRETEQLRQRMVDSGYNRLPRPMPRRHDCMVAGTIVTTHRGAIKIEDVRIGDMVLSKDIESGQLTFRAVTQATIRDPEELVAIQAGEELLRCTRGHHFWVSGRGWTKAGDLLSGMVLHGAENPLKIDRVFAGGKEETFNLRVAGNANYFVGNARILSHDVTSRGPSEMAIPGYKAPRDRDEGRPRALSRMGGMGVFGGMSGMMAQ